MANSPVQAVREASLAADRLYIKDLYGWSVQQAAALARRSPEALDWDNLAEEIAGLRNAQRNAWVSLCGRVIEHLLKIEHGGTGECLVHWESEIERWQEQMARKLKANPSLTGRYPEIFGLAWEQGRHDAVRGMAKSAGHRPATNAWRDMEHRVEALLPEACPYRLLEVTARNTEDRKPKVRHEIMPPSVAEILNSRAEGEYPVRQWPELDIRLQPSPLPLRGPGRQR